MSDLTVKFPLLSAIFLAVLAGRTVYAEILSDPTLPPGGESSHKGSQHVTVQPRWMLTAILIATERRTATINGKRVDVGDDINGARVLAIEPNQVTLQPAKNNKTVNLQLLPNDFKRMAGKDSHGK